VFVHTRGYETTPAPAEAGQCPRCRGLGMSPGGPSEDPGPCGSCDSTGRVVYADPRRTERVTYLATAAQDVVDVGQSPLNVFVGQLLLDFPEAGDVAIWSLEDSICAAPVLVAVIRPDRTGKPAPTYL
jgi:hypothetical protein